MAGSEDRWRQMEDNLRNNKEFLVANLHVTDLIHNPVSFFHVIPEKDRQEIEALSSTNQHDKAARMFLDSFLSSDDETKWSVLDQALWNRSGLNLVRKILMNEETPALDTQQHERRQVILQRDLIANHVSAAAMAEYLLQEEFLTEEQYQQVQATNQTKGDITANILQLELACRRDNFIPRLLDFLCRHQHFRLAKIIDPERTKKICDSSSYEDPENEGELSNDTYPSGTMAATMDYSSDPESGNLMAMPCTEKSAPVADMNNLNYEDEPVASRTRSKTKLLNDKTINIETVPGQESRQETRNIVPLSAHSLDGAIPATREQRQSCYHSPDTTGQRSAGTPKEKLMSSEKSMPEMPIDCQGRTVTITNVICLGPQFGDQGMNAQKLTPGRADVIQNHNEESDETDDDRLKDNSNARHTKIKDVGRRERQHEAKPTVMPTHYKPKKNTDVRPKVKIDRRPLPEKRVDAEENSRVRLKEKTPELKKTVTPHELYHNEDIGNHFDPPISPHRKAAASENRETPAGNKAGWKPTIPADASNIDPSCIGRQMCNSQLPHDIISRLERCHDCGLTFQSKNVLDKHKKDACLINRLPTGLEQFKPTSAGSSSAQTLPAVKRDLSHDAIFKSTGSVLESSPELNIVAGGSNYQSPQSRDPMEGCLRCDRCGTAWKSINALKNHQEGECLKYKIQKDTQNDVKRSPPDSGSRIVCENVLNKHAQSHTKKVTPGLGFKSVETSRGISEGTARPKQDEAKLLRQSYISSKQDTDPKSIKHSDHRPSTQTPIKATELSGVSAKEQVSKQKTPPPQVSSGNTVQYSKDGRLIDAARSRVDSRRQQIEDIKSRSGGQQAPSRSHSLTNQSKGPTHEYQTVKSKPNENQVSNPQLLPSVINKLKRCLDCGQTFQSQDFLDKHQKGACPENRNEPSEQQSKPKSTGSLASKKTSAVKREVASEVKLVKGAPSAGCSCGRTVCEHVSDKHAQKSVAKVKPGFGFQSPQTLKYNIAEDSD